jgi:hypothetical protein
LSAQAKVGDRQAPGWAFANGLELRDDLRRTTESGLYGDAAASLAADARGPKTTGRWAKRDVTPGPRSGDVFGQ